MFPKDASYSVCSRGTIMPDDDLIEPTLAPEIFVDYFTQHAVSDGIMSCVGYRKRADGKIIVVRLMWPAAHTSAAIQEAATALLGATQSVPIKEKPLKPGVH